MTEKKKTTRKKVDVIVMLTDCAAEINGAVQQFKQGQTITDCLDKYKKILNKRHYKVVKQ